MNEKLFDYLFEDKETGEQFLVEADSYTEAVKIVRQYFDNYSFLEKMSVEEGEMLGLDTY